ncbi:MAG: hypothetical protein ACOC5T_01385 [Elusimicrobiota bacterium]
MNHYMKMLVLFLFVSITGCSHALISNSYDKEGAKGPSSSYTGEGKYKKMHIEFKKNKPVVAPPKEETTEDIIIEERKIKQYRITKKNGQFIIELVK